MDNGAPTEEMLTAVFAEATKRAMIKGGGSMQPSVIDEPMRTIMENDIPNVFRKVMATVRAAGTETKTLTMGSRRGPSVSDVIMMAKRAATRCCMSCMVGRAF